MIDARDISNHRKTLSFLLNSRSILQLPLSFLPPLGLTTLPFLYLSRLSFDLSFLTLLL
jgi:hypothetical protein